MRQRTLTRNQRSLLALGLGWLASSLAIFIWVALNVYFGFIPIWLDVIVGALWVVWLANRLHPYRTNWTNRRPIQILLWLSAVSLALTGLLYGLSELFPESFSQFRSWVEISPLTSILEFANNWRQRYQSSGTTFFIPEQGRTAFALGCAFLGGWLLLACIIISPTLSRFDLVLQKQQRQITQFLPKRLTRRSRWGYHLKRLLLSGLMVMTALLGSAAYADQTPLAPSTYKIRETFRGPQAFAYITVLHSDAKSGALFAGTLGGGVFRSSDGGSTWQAASAGLTVTYVQALHSDAKSGALFAGTENGVFRSSDGGSTWQAASAGLTATYVQALHSDAKSGALFAGTLGGGVFRSSDGGSTWQAASAGLTNTYVQALHSDAKSGALFAGTENGVFRSSDGGSTWQAASAGLTATDVIALHSDAKSGALFAGTRGGGVFRSSDGGSTWQAASAGLTATYVQALHSNAKSGALFAGTANGVFRSSDGGSTWQAASAGLTNTYVQALHSDAKSGALFAGTANGVFRSSDGGSTWQAASAGLTDTTVRALHSDAKSGALFAGTWGGGVFRSSDGGSTWQAASAGLTATYVQALHSDAKSGALFAGTANGVFRSSDGGSTWQAASAGLTDTTVRALHSDAKSGALFAGTANGVFRSSDGGSTWQAASAGLTATYVQALHSDAKSGALFAGTENGVFRSSDGGSTWQAASAGLTDTYVQALHSDAKSGALFAGTLGGGVFRSSDGGSTWQAASAGLTDTYVQALHSDAKSGALFAGTENGVFRSSDGGSTWQAASAGLTATDVIALHSDAKSGALFAGTRGGGVFRSSDGGSTWQAASAGLTNTTVQGLHSDAKSGALFAGTWGGGVFRSSDGGSTWQAASAGLTNTIVRALHSDAKSGALFAGTWGGGVFRSSDGGSTWQAASAGLTNPYVQALHSDAKSGALFAGTDNGVFRLSDDGSTWQEISYGEFLVSNLWFDASGSLLGTTLGSRRVLLIQSPDALWIWLVQWAEFETPQVFIDPQTNEWVVRQTWGLQITTHTFSSQDAQLGSWVKLRLFAWGLTQRLAPYQNQILLALLALLIYGLFSRYVRAGWSFGVSPLALLWPGRWHKLADPSKLGAANIHWQRLVQSELLAWGDVKPDDLLAVPQPYRNYALQTYAAQHADAAQLDYVAHQQHLRLQNPDIMQAWQNHWQAAMAQASLQGGLMPAGWAHITQLQTQLCQALRFQTLTLINDALAQGLIVEARHLPIGVPSRFPLLFVAQPNPTPDTVQQLLSLVLPVFAGDSGNLFGLCVLLAPPDTAEQSAMQLRRLINESLQKPNLAVLSYDDTLNIMLARDAAKALAILIAKQRDLSLISPFKPKSAVAESMFLGREQETRQVVSGIEQGSYAIIGNRRIGKTSLLRNIERQLGAKAQQILPFYVDAQAAKDTDDIIRILKRSNLVLSDDSLAAVEEAFYGQKQAGRLPVMLIDEADALFIADRRTGEQLGQRFRAWSQASLCRFVFCGSGGLARLMADAESGFFNFAQHITLGYLAPEHARELLRRPLEHLGVELVEAETLLTKVIDLTSGHPSIVQLTGKYLVDEKINKRMERRVTPEDIEDLYHNSEFAEAYLETVLGEVRLRQYALEYAIVLVAPDERFDYRGLQNALQQADIVVEGEAVLKALDNLVMFSLLSKQGRSYQFVPSAFHRILNEHNEVDVILKGVKRNLTPPDTASASAPPAQSSWTVSDIADL